MSMIAFLIWEKTSFRVRDVSIRRTYDYFQSLPNVDDFIGDFLLY